ncbi:MAG: helix-turn-helix domain-containing protein [Clostridiales bacterium]|nr:helix-turn-helix domain-containing protein [Clostridiales bacterium]
MENSNFSGLVLYNYLLYKNPCERKDVFMKHTHNFYEILYIQSGDISYVIENREYKLKKHDLVFTRPTTYHYLQLESNAEYERHNIAFYPDFVNAEFLDRISPDVEVIHCPSGGIIAQNFERIEYYKEHLEQSEFEQILSGLLQEILLNIRFAKENLLGISSSLSPILEKALAYINENLFTIKSISEISNALFITESYFFKLFKDQLKIPPKKYINTKRILHAQKLIQCGSRPTDVYEQCGFESYVGFYKQYVKAFGIAPSEEKKATDA